MYLDIQKIVRSDLTGLTGLYLRYRENDGTILSTLCSQNTDFLHVIIINQNRQHSSDGQWLVQENADAPTDYIANSRIKQSYVTTSLP